MITIALTYGIIALIMLCACMGLELGFRKGFAEAPLIGLLLGVLLGLPGVLILSCFTDKEDLWRSKKMDMWIVKSGQSTELCWSMKRLLEASDAYDKGRMTEQEYCEMRDILIGMILEE